MKSFGFRSTNAVVFVLPFAIFLLLVLLVPIILVVMQSLDNPAGAFEGYKRAVSSELLRRVFWTTIEISALTAAITLLLAYPVAYHLSRQTPMMRSILMIFVLLPFWTSILVKGYAFTIVLGHDGILNTLIRYANPDLAGLSILFNRTGVIIGLSHFLMPFMILPILSSLLMQSEDYRKASFLMGASRARTFWQITFPLSVPGVVAGVVICVTLSFGMFVIPAILGGAQDMMLANMINFYIRDVLNWNLASVLAVILLLLSAILIGTLLRIRGAASFLGAK